MFMDLKFQMGFSQTLDVMKMSLLATKGCLTGLGYPCLWQVLILPVLSTMCVLAKPIIRVLFQRYAFDSAASTLVSSLFLCCEYHASCFEGFSITNFPDSSF